MVAGDAVKFHRAGPCSNSQSVRNSVRALTPLARLRSLEKILSFVVSIMMFDEEVAAQMSESALKELQEASIEKMMKVDMNIETASSSSKLKQFVLCTSTARIPCSCR